MIGGDLLGGNIQIVDPLDSYVSFHSALHIRHGF